MTPLDQLDPFAVAIWHIHWPGIHEQWALLRLNDTQALTVNMGMVRIH